MYEAEESSVKGGYDTTVRLIKDHPDVQGIIYSIDLVAVGGIRAAYDCGYSVPDQLGLIGIDNSIYGEICMPRLTTLNNKPVSYTHLIVRLVPPATKPLL